ncbi:hypothetical protein R6258_11140 [Halomonas sp. HP20-15]|uniref:COG4648 family protein n=1 Tax=Halomonas sp. HP20-15 TaxID=3085901 RepID=UPI0029817B2A|nr:hypothetical protein [Halomonas sp. HP20-15]MDW5377472.1 hypothetical protein [Halomonas sp. HP20-15]
MAATNTPLTKSAAGPTVLLNLLLGVLALGWPWLSGLLAERSGGWVLLTLVAGLACWRLPTGYRRWAVVVVIPALLLALAGHARLTVLLWPVVVNLALLGVFGWSLAHPPSVIERLARREQPDLPASGVRYTRRVTQVWCGFFAINAGLALATVIHGDRALWTLYNGGIAYCAMALLFTGEWCLRQRIKKKSAS